MHSGRLICTARSPSFDVLLYCWSKNKVGTDPPLWSATVLDTLCKIAFVGHSKVKLEFRVLKKHKTREKEMHVQSADVGILTQVMPPTSFPGLFPITGTLVVGWGLVLRALGGSPLFLQIIDLKYFCLATLMALFVSFCTSLYQLPSRDVPRDEAGMPRPRDTSSLSILVLAT